VRVRARVRARVRVRVRVRVRLRVRVGVRVGVRVRVRVRVRVTRLGFERRHAPEEELDILPTLLRLGLTARVRVKGEGEG